MAIIETRKLTFTYALQNKKALDDISLNINESEFVVLCGKSGCGKSTLLRHLKKNMMPYGSREGEIIYLGEKLEELDDRRSASEIGFVQQNPDNQLVTDKVWHELAFGLESLGLDNKVIRTRVAEMASFFDIQTWFRKDVTELSGGQKQLLNLASIMAMQPKILILDEPTSQLDPIAASEFIKTVYRINRELGTTVIISEHRLEELFPMADRVLVMDEGKIIADDTPWNVGNLLAGKSNSNASKANENAIKSNKDADESNENDDVHPMFYGLPSVMKIYSKAVKAGVKPYLIDGKEYSPLNVREGRLWIDSIFDDKKEVDFSGFLDNAVSNNSVSNTASNTTSNIVSSNTALNNTNTKNSDVVIKAKDLWFRYQKTSQDVLRGLNLEIKKGELYCLLGGNGVGKSTLLSNLSGILKPTDGKLKIDGKLSMLPQNPQALFTEITVEEELLEAIYYAKLTDEEKVEKVNSMLETMEISHLRKSHPYDLSGGEQQRLALGKILLLEPTILLLDEPTKGLDPFFKITLKEILDKLKNSGVTIFMVSHDIEFCAEYADRCGMLFDGEVISDGTPREFFMGNAFYTTQSNRIARKWMPDAITWEEVLKCLTC